MDQATEAGAVALMGEHTQSPRCPPAEAPQATRLLGFPSSEASRAELLARVLHLPPRGKERWPGAAGPSSVRTAPASKYPTGLAEASGHLQKAGCPSSVS